jgi:hypothetical protein
MEWEASIAGVDESGKFFHNIGSVMSMRALAVE